MISSLPFQLPAPEGFEETPVWDGRTFRIGDQSLPVLEYSENFAGWSDDLTALHEDAAGDSHPIDLASRRGAIEQIKPAVSSTSPVILEIGCSSGFLIRELVRDFPEAVVIGADVVKEPLFRLAEALPGVPLMRFDLLRCPIPDDSVDVVVMLNVLEHIEDDSLALANVARILKPGGTVVLEVPAGPLLYDSYDAELQHFRRYTASELVSKLQAQGFEISRKSHLGFLLYPAFALVKLFNKWQEPRKKESVVEAQAKSSGSSAIVRAALKLEEKLFSTLQLPFGIRVTAVGKRSRR